MIRSDEERDRDDERRDVDDDHGGDERGVSTVLDVGLCLLLVSAAVGVLYAVPDGSPDERGDVAAPAATTVATSTATVEYQPAAADRRRVDRGTVASLLARAAVANATLEGEPVTGDEAYVDAVRSRSKRALAGVAGAARVRVRAQWRPVPGSDLRGTVAVGPEPPQGADVHAATLSVPVGDGRGAGPGPTSTEHDARSAAERASNGSATALGAAATRDDCEAFGREAARHVAAVLFPPAPTDAALDGDSGAVMRDRYESAAAALGTESTGLDRPADAATRNRWLAGQFAPRFAERCREVGGRAGGGREGGSRTGGGRETVERRSPAAEPDPTSTARPTSASSPTSATVVVRTWSP